MSVPAYIFSSQYSHTQSFMTFTLVLPSNYFHCMDRRHIHSCFPFHYHLWIPELSSIFIEKYESWLRMASIWYHEMWVSRKTSKPASKDCTILNTSNFHVSDQFDDLELLFLELFHSIQPYPCLHTNWNPDLLITLSYHSFYYTKLPILKSMID